ncbi:MAG TPA: BTAD domain-containing putative transcriptional regulator [Rugosimonospora sp.]
MTDMEFGLLGPLLVSRGGVVVPVRRGNQRTVLARLLLAANRTVSVDAIAEALWGSVLPPSARVTIRNYVRRLRQGLGDDGRKRIAAQPHGYMIHVAPGELDVSRFEDLLETARASAQAGAWDETAARARAALALWRGEPLADVESAALALREVPRLAELRWQALETRIDADLRRGAHAEVVAELRHLVGTHPLREQVHGFLMLALHRCGRSGEALAAYQHARKVLAGELGAEPGARLQHLHQQILTAAPALLLREPALTTFQLPAAPADFPGRQAECEMVPDTLAQDDGVPVVAISGQPGVGKTTLALYAAHQARNRVADPANQLSVAQLELLASLAEHPRTRPGQLARLLNLRPNTVTTLVNALIHEGMISRSSADDDRRAITLTVTDEGLRAVHAWQAANSAVLNLALSTLTASQRNALARATPALGALAQAINHLADTPLLAPPNSQTS